MRSLNLPEHAQCGCDSGGGEHFKCYCNELKENSQTTNKLRKRLSSCKNFIKNRSKKSYGNVINASEVDDGSTNAYTLKKDLKGKSL